MKKSLIALLALVLASVMLFAACGDEAASNSDAAADAETTAAVEETTEAAADVETTAAVDAETTAAVAE